MESIRSDVVIVGAGGAGLRAAIAVAETNPDLRVALISKVYPMRSHTVAAEGGAAGVVKDNDNFDNHFNDTVTGGDWLCDQDAVDLFVNEAPKELIRMEHWGCPWSRESTGRVAVRAFGGMKVERTWYAADKTGFHMLHTLFQTSRPPMAREPSGTTAGVTRAHRHRGRLCHSPLLRSAVVSVRLSCFNYGFTQ